MKFVILATAERRARRPFQLTSHTGRGKFGLMNYNQATGRHEIEMPEAEFLAVARDIALAGRIHGNCVFVAGFRDDAQSIEMKTAAVSEPVSNPTSEAAKHAPKDEPTATLPEVSARTPFLSLRKIAKDEGVDIDGLKGAAAVAKAILDARKP